MDKVSPQHTWGYGHVYLWESAQLPCLSPCFLFLLITSSPLPRDQKCPQACWGWCLCRGKGLASPYQNPGISPGPCPIKSRSILTNLIMELTTDFLLIPKEDIKVGLSELWGGPQHLYACLHPGQLTPSSILQSYPITESLTARIKGRGAQKMLTERPDVTPLTDSNAWYAFFSGRT